MNAGAIRERETVRRPLSNITMTVLGTRSRRHPVWSTAVVVCIVEFVDGLVMAICEDGRLAVVGIHIGSSMFDQVFLAVQQLIEVLWHSV